MGSLEGHGLELFVRVGSGLRSALSGRISSPASMNKRTRLQSIFSYRLASAVLRRV